MPDITDYRELSLEGINIDETVRRFAVLRAQFGEGYGAGALVGSANGTHRWTLSAGVWPDDEDYGNMIESMPRMEYYWSFFAEHVSNGNHPFLIEWRGRKYFASFEDVEQSVEVFTSNLFAGNLTISQRRVAGFYEGTDGCVFDPSFVEDSFWGWYDENSFSYFTSLAIDKTASINNLGINGDIDSTGTTQNSLATQRFNAGAANGYLNTTADPKIYEAFFVLKVRASTFSSYQGILSADVTTAAMVGNTGDTKLVNFSFGSTYSYYKNGVAFAEAAQATPMATFGVINGRWSSGITLSNLQIGKDRAFTDRYLKADIGEIILCDVALTTEQRTDLDGWLRYKWGIV